LFWTWEQDSDLWVNWKNCVASSSKWLSYIKYRRGYNSKLLRHYSHDGRWACLLIIDWINWRQNFLSHLILLVTTHKFSKQNPCNSTIKFSNAIREMIFTEMFFNHIPFWTSNPHILIKLTHSLNSNKFLKSYRLGPSKTMIITISY